MLRGMYLSIASPLKSPCLKELSMRKQLILPTALALLCCLLTACNGPTVHTGPASTTSAEAQTSAPPAEAVTIRMTFVGDCTFGTLNNEEGDNRFPKVYEHSGSLTYPFDGVRHLFEQDDLTVINFEGTLTHAAQEADKKWRFKGPPEYAQILPASSVEAATLANNHAYDYLDQGFRDTVTSLRAAGVGLIYKDNPLITEIKGVQVVIVGGNTAFAEDFGTTPEEVAQGVLAQIQRYKRPENIVVALMHWGLERTERPDTWQTRTARAFVDAGADLVVGHHPHVIQGIERYNGKYIAYSLANFAFGGNSVARANETLETFLLHADFKVAPGLPAAEIAVTPCYMTSSDAKTATGGLRNDYRPRIVTGEQAQRVLSVLLWRSALLEDGIQAVDIFEVD